MGMPSTSEDIEERKDDARFCDGESAPDLKALKAAPRSKRPQNRGAPNLVDRLKREIDKQKRAISKLVKELEAAKKDATSARGHLRQLQERSNTHSDLILEAENRRLRAELESKETELENLRTMGRLFPTNG